MRTFLALLALVSIVRAETYELHNLGLGEIYGLNSSGQATGVSNDQAFRWSGNVMTDLSVVLGSQSSKGFGINDSGFVVGIMNDGLGLRSGFVTDGTTFVPSAGFMGEFQFHDINNGGLILGRYNLDLPTQRDFLLQGSMVTDLPEGGVFTSIDASGRVAGVLNGNPVIYDNGTITQLFASNNAYLADIQGDKVVGSDGGMIVLGSGGTSNPINIDPMAIINLPDNTFMTLGPGVANAIDGSLIVGQSNGLGVIFGNGTVTDLNLITSGLGDMVIVSANVTSVGSIGATAIDSLTGDKHAVLLTPVTVQPPAVPEPSTALFGLAVCSIILRRPTR